MSHWHCTVTRNPTDIRYECHHEGADPIPFTERYCATIAVAQHARGRAPQAAGHLGNSLAEAQWPPEACTMFKQAYILACHWLYSD